MNKRTIRLLKYIVSDLLIIFFLILLSGCVFGASNDDDYGSEYETHWKSKDGYIEFINNNRNGMAGKGHYEGKYYLNGEIYQIYIKVNYEYCNARLDDMTLEDVYAGKAEYDQSTNTYIIYVEKVNNDLSVYKPGDTIVFYQVD